MAGVPDAATSVPAAGPAGAVATGGSGAGVISTRYFPFSLRAGSSPRLIRRRMVSGETPRRAEASAMVSAGI